MLCGCDVSVIVVGELFVVETRTNERFHDSLHWYRDLLVSQILFECCHVVECWIVPHLLIAAGWNIFLRSTVDGTPVTHNKAIETKKMPQMIVERQIVAASIHMVDFVVAAHHDADVAFPD